MGIEFIKEPLLSYQASFNKQKDYLSLYVHIPFCQDFCSYCMFKFFKYSNEAIENYLHFLEKRAKEYSKILTIPISSIYIGGGTPNILSIDQMKRLFSIIEDNFILEKKDNSFCFETNPVYLTKEKIDFLSTSFINRISIGIQTFNFNVLKEENRAHLNSITDYYAMFSYIKERFKHKHYMINADLIAGLEGQSYENIVNDFEFLALNEIQKITLYPLRFDNDHTSESLKYFRNLKKSFVDKIIEEIENKYPNYYYDKNFYNEGYYSFINKNTFVPFNNIYFEAPALVDDKVQSNICLGYPCHGWFRADFAYHCNDEEEIEDWEEFREQDDFTINYKKNIEEFNITGCLKDTFT